mmetsp:Transcript_163654/g.520009  ORF Transcript_163654/g.520009 Transcript_163654/m.520009 type:complete len:129 (+) Transcript_163654:255-641(+)
MLPILVATCCSQLQGADFGSSEIQEAGNLNIPWHVWLESRTRGAELGSVSFMESRRRLQLDTPPANACWCAHANKMCMLTTMSAVAAVNAAGTRCMGAEETDTTPALASVVVVVLIVGKAVVVGRGFS